MQTRAHFIYMHLFSLYIYISSLYFFSLSLIATLLNYEVVHICFCEVHVGRNLFRVVFNCSEPPNERNKHQKTWV